MTLLEEESNNTPTFDRTVHRQPDQLVGASAFNDSKTKHQRLPPVASVPESDMPVPTRIIPKRSCVIRSQDFRHRRSRAL